MESRQGVETLLTAKQVAERLNISVSWVRGHARGLQPSIRAVKLGGSVRFREADVGEFVKRCLTEAKTRGFTT